jgi:hypothetical protein
MTAAFKGVERERAYGSYAVRIYTFTNKYYSELNMSLLTVEGTSQILPWSKSKYEKLIDKI